jgi:hypothetical protein
MHQAEGDEREKTWNAQGGKGSRGCHHDLQGMKGQRSRKLGVEHKRSWDRQGVNMTGNAEQIVDNFEY